MRDVLRCVGKLIAQFIRRAGQKCRRVERIVLGRQFEDRVIGKHDPTHEITTIRGVRPDRMLDRTLPHHRAQMALGRILCIFVLPDFAFVFEEADCNDNAAVVVRERRALGVEEG